MLRKPSVGQHRLVAADLFRPIAGRKTLVARAAAGLPLMLLSVGWTAHLLEEDGSAPAKAALPDPVPVPSEAVEAPASYSQPGQVARGVPRGSAQRVVATASTHGIPSAALAAYQRAETVIDAADEECGIEWQLIGAIGRVESDHGRYGGSTLGRDGVSRPGIYGIALDGTDGTAEITDTDAGRFDRDVVYDRAVGPMQFIPSTWSEVGVDADGDGKRDPQDVDDAALAAAVYLCSGKDDLGTVAGRRAAVHRYNHSRAYVDLVLSVREAYLDGEYTAVPTNTTSAVTFSPGYTFTAPTGGTKSAPAGGTKAGAGDGVGAGSGTSGTGTSSPPAAPSQPTAPPPAPAPSKTNDPVKALTETVEKTVKGTTTALGTTVDRVLSLPQAILACTSLGYPAITTPTQKSTCLDQHTS